VQDNINQGVKPGRRTIFHNLLDPELIAGSNVPTVDDMAGEAFSMCVAASDTTGNALTTATYQLIRNTKIYGLVKGELRRAFPDPNQRFPYATLEKLPYLTGVVKEAQR
jgi:cytochrome P450